MIAVRPERPFSGIDVTNSKASCAPELEMTTVRLLRCIVFKRSLKKKERKAFMQPEDSEGKTWKTLT